MDYSTKHPVGTRPDPVIVTALAEVTTDGRVTCEEAHDLAGRLNVSPAAIGKTMDLLEYRITECQMGLFGYEPEKKVLVAADSVSDDMRRHIEKVVVDGQMTCTSCWEVARTLGVQKSEVAAACELLELKITTCQLGAF